MKKLLIIAVVYPEPQSTAAGKRMLQLIHFFLEQHYQITIASTAISSELSIDFDALGVSKASIQLNHESFDGFIADLNPEIVLFDRFLTEEQFGWRVAMYAPTALRILDTEDLHSLRKAREHAFKKKEEFTTNYWLQTDNCKRELASIFRSDISLIISSYEMNLLLNVVRMDEAILLHVPFMLPKLNSETIKKWKPFEERDDFICIGNGRHAPNVDAISWLKTEIWPLIRKELHHVKLHIYGAYLPEHIMQMNNSKEGFLVHGWVSDATTVMQQAKVNLAPLRFGAGLKGKLIDAMTNGCPNVTTSIGAEGMCEGVDFAGCVTDNAQIFADSAIALFRNKEQWITAQNNGIANSTMNFNAAAVKKTLGDRIKIIADTLERHRSQNLIGQLLQHQTMASTKYMAKWIEAKNKGA